jgi:hypothetical protein
LPARKETARMTMGVDRRVFLQGLATGSAAAALVGCRTDRGVDLDRGYVDPNPLADFEATGSSWAVTTTSKEATRAAVDVLDKGGNAADAYIAAALTQAVVEVGLVSIGGAFGLTFFDAKTGVTAGASGTLGPAAAEPYDFDRFDPVTLTGRAMPVPGYIGAIGEVGEYIDKAKHLGFEVGVFHAPLHDAAIPPIFVEDRDLGVFHSSEDLFAFLANLQLADIFSCLIQSG